MHQSICVFLNSKTASSYINKYTSECLFVLPALVIPKKSNISVSVQSASIPYSFFNCDDFNDNFKSLYNLFKYSQINIPSGKNNADSFIYKNFFVLQQNCKRNCSTWLNHNF